MAWVIAENSLGWPRITDVDISAKVRVGSIVRASDPTYGAGEFIYLHGVTSTVTGNLVVFNDPSFDTTLSPDTANLGQSVGVAMAPTTVSAKYGWYQIGGLATIKKTAVQVSAKVALYQSATAGRVMDTAATGKKIENCRSANSAAVTATTSTILAQINRPFMQGSVT